MHGHLKGLEIVHYCVTVKHSPLPNPFSLCLSCPTIPLLVSFSQQVRAFAFAYKSALALGTAIAIEEYNV